MKGNPDNGHYEPGVMSIVSTDQLEELVERCTALVGGDEKKGREAAAFVLAQALQGATVIDADERAKLEAWVNECDAKYRKDLNVLQRELTRLNSAQKAHKEKRAQWEAFDAATSQAPVVNSQQAANDGEGEGASVLAPDVSPTGWMRGIHRLQVAVPFTVYVAILIASVLLGFDVDNGSFNALQLSQKTLGFSTTNGLAAAFAVLVPAIGHVAGLLVWWILDSDADKGWMRRPRALLGFAAVSAAFLVTTIVSLRVAYLHHVGASVPVWPMVGISLSVLSVDICASALRHNPWAAKREELSDGEAEAAEEVEDVAERVVAAQNSVMASQANLATAIAKLLDAYFVHFADKAGYIEMLGDTKTVKDLAAGRLLYPPQDAARLRWLISYSESMSAPFSPMAVGDGLVQFVPSEGEVEQTVPEGEDDEAPVSPLQEVG